MRETVKMTKLKSNNGITLIALVITIIVLLILAGVAISMLSGENGILNQAADAKTKTDNASEKEQVELAALAALTAGHGNVDDAEYYRVLNSELDKIKGYKGEIKKGDLPKTITIGNNSYTIEEDGEVSIPSEGDTTIAVESITISGEATVNVGENIQLTATIKPDNATNKTVIWTSSDENIATIDSTGKVTGLIAGTVTITATVNGKATTYKINVTNAKSTMITFTFNNVEYQAEEGMTWKDWVDDTSLNTIGLYYSSVTRSGIRVDYEMCLFKT